MRDDPQTVEKIAGVKIVHKSEWLQDNYGVNSAKNLSSQQLTQAVDLLDGSFEVMNGGKTLRQRGGKYLGCQKAPQHDGRGGFAVGEALLGEAGRTWAYGLGNFKLPVQG